MGNQYAKDFKKIELEVLKEIDSNSKKLIL